MARSTRYDKGVLQRWIKSAPGEVEDWWRSNVMEMRDDVKLGMGTSPPGEAYTRDGRTHVASRPGYPPNVDTGALRNSVQVTKRARLKFVLHDGVNYGLMLERGTSDMRARPFMAPIIIEWRQRKLARRVNELRDRLRHV